MCRVGSRVPGRGAITFEQFASTCDQHFNSFASTDKTKNMTDGRSVAAESCVVTFFYRFSKLIPN